MITKKIKIIILIIILVVLLSGLVYILKTQKKDLNNTTNQINSLNSNPKTPSSLANNQIASTTNSNQKINYETESIINTNNQKLASTTSQELEKINNSPFLTELKTNHPEYNAKQLEFYSLAAANKDLTSCRGKNDENDCIAAVAFLTRIDGLCGETGGKDNQLSCSNIILDEKASEEITKCQAYPANTLRAICLLNIFNLYKQPEDCINLKVGEIKKTCESAAQYQVALKQENKNLCNSILNKDIKLYCSENIISKSSQPISAPDSDNDGLSDEEELNKYYTDPKNPDTDGDGYLDGAEVKNGYNPNGPGLLIIN